MKKLNVNYSRYCVIFMILFSFSISGSFGQILQQFDLKFTTAEDKKDLLKLRDFLDKRDEEYSKLKMDLQSLVYYSAADSEQFIAYKKSLDAFILKHPNRGDIFERNELDKNLRNLCIKTNAVDTIVESGVTKIGYNIPKALEVVNYWISEVGHRSKIKQELEVVSKDRDDATHAIQKIYDVEHGNYYYKLLISITYAAIISILIFISFYFLFKKSAAGIGNDFLNGNGLQFIALFAIIISTILFGILGILEGKELAAILSGIAGFILGKGLNVKLTQTPATPPTPPDNS